MLHIDAYIIESGKSGNFGRDRRRDFKPTAKGRTVKSKLFGQFHKTHILTLVIAKHKYVGRL